MEQREGINKIYRRSWPVDNLFGSSRFELTAADRGIWNDLLDMAKISRIRPGLIAPSNNTGYTYEWLSSFLNIEKDQLISSLKVLRETGRINENGNGIEIINWKRYQPEYDRQKPYRKAKNDSDPDKYIQQKYGHMVQR